MSSIYLLTCSTKNDILEAVYLKRFLGLFILLILPCSARAGNWQLKNTVYKDYRNFYSRENLGRLGIGIGIAGVVSNTPIDEEIQEWYHESLRSKSTNNFSEIVKPFGGKTLTVPVYLVSALLGEITDNTRLGSTIGEWGSQSLRTILVGVPPLLFLQRVLGASRPGESDSHWQPFKDDNAVSGHSFMGAVPFITAAKMTDNLYLKYSLYLGSTLCGVSRINDDAHYFSQAALGWWLAYLATAGVEQTKTEKEQAVSTPALINNGIGMTVMFHF